MRDCYRCVMYESHRCRATKECPEGLQYEEYVGSTVRQCLYATVEVFQDGYIHCPVMECMGCKHCMERFGDGSRYEYDESQNYERKPRVREVKEVKPESQKCSYRGRKVDCGMLYPKTGMCGLLIKTGTDLERQLDNFRAHADCEIYKAVLDKRSRPEESTEITKVITNGITFDYSTVDKDTGAFLQEKASKITEIRIKSVVAIGKELKEAQDKLASHNKYEGSFQKWVESIGITPRTAYNYINGFDYVVKNFHNIEDAEHIQPSLLFAASKPSAPAELQEAVKSGDITTHKQYKELEKKLKEAEIELKDVRHLKEAESKLHFEKTKNMQELANQTVDLNREVFNLRQQLEQAKRNSDPAKVQELGEKISMYQKMVIDYNQEIGRLNKQLNEKDQQLKDKPIEVAATQIKEIIPNEVAAAVYYRVADLYEGIAKLTDKEIQIFAGQVAPNSYDDISCVIDTAIDALEKIQSAAYEATTSALEPEGHCGDCAHADMDGVSDEQLDDSKTRCTVTGEIVDFENRCGEYERYGG